VNRALLLLLLVIALGLGGATAANYINRETSVRGVILDVQGQSIGVPDSFKIRDNAGREWTFRADPSIVTDPTHPNNAAHLRAHMATVDQVTVYYRDSPQGPVAYRVTD
jgi:hypothetical protein